MQWWRDAVMYQVYVRSFSDSDGDGVGDLEGICQRLGYLELLGVDAIWLTPFYPSPMADNGYDVSDPRDVDPLFGDLEIFDDLVGDAHDHNMKVVLDLVPNHTSSQHEWFQAALSSAPGSPERDRYHFLPGRGPDGAEPPNNWRSVFGGPAWTRVAANPAGTGRAEWYLHLFSPEQPDLNWDNDEVWTDLEKTLRYWLDRGVDGFRIEVAHGMSKPHGLPDAGSVSSGLLEDVPGDPRFDDDGVHEVHRMIRKVVDRYPDRMVIGEVWVADHQRFARYLRPDELHLGFNFRLARARFEAGEIRRAVEHSLEAVAGVPGPATWTLSNHDIARPVTRYGGGGVGRKRARAMALVELALPGVVYLYNGEELGLPDAEMVDASRHDPVWERSGRIDRGRDACRVPMPWEGAPPGYGFTTGEPWLPMPREYGLLTVAEQLEDTGSMLSLVRRAVELRKTHPGFVGEGEGLEWFGAPAGCLAFRRTGATLVCALNTSNEPVPLPPGEVLLNSGPIYGDMLPPDTSAWLA